MLSDLRGKRVSAQVAEKAVEGVYEGKEENDLINAYIDRKMPSLRDKR